MIPSMISTTRNQRTAYRIPLGRCLFFSGLLALTLVANARPQASDVKQIELGRRIYMEGLLPSGKPLQGKRENSSQVEGADAACETCHRRSGMGSLEGNIPVPPISGRFLFATDEDRPIALLDPRAPKNVTRPHKPYTEKSLGAALRKGVNVGGRPMNGLMPKYSLSDKEIKALTAYLKQLSANLSPGVGEDKLYFATIVTPGVDPKKQEAMLGMMRAAFAQRNATQENYSGRMRMPIDLLPRTLRNWELKAWELKGNPETWANQLAEKYKRDPVFAVVSGLSNSTWEPVHAFCQQEKLPCILPSTDLTSSATDFYSLYFSQGVALEAKVLAKHLRDQGEKAPHRLVQIYRDDDVGRGAAQALTSALQDSGIQVENRALSGQEPINPGEALKDLSDKDAVLLWLHPADVSALGTTETALPSTLYISGFLLKDNFTAIPKTWLPNVRLVYPYETGENHKKNVLTLDKWLKTWSLPLVDEIFQSEVFFNLLFLTDLTSQMLDNLYRDYLLERAEDMLSLGSNVSAYPHLSLARGQRFASKGAYIAHLDSKGNVAADSDWIVP